MPIESPRLLFVPVSGPFGMGEYARSAAIAHAVRARWPRAAVRFLLSREAPYAADPRFDATLLPASPTRCTAQVNAAIAAFAPDVVIFDNAGRTAQLRAARSAGAAVVFVSARRRQRRRAGRLRWLRLIDEHWIAYPRVLDAPPGLLETLKRRWLRRPEPRHLDVILPPADPARRARGFADLALETAPVLVVPGGGTGHPGTEDAGHRQGVVQVAAEGLPQLRPGGLLVFVPVESPDRDVGVAKSEAHPLTDDQAQPERAERLGKHVSGVATRPGRKPLTECRIAEPCGLVAHLPPCYPVGGGGL